MSISLLARDETLSGIVVHELPLEFPTERITARDLIRERVYQEVMDFNRKEDQREFFGLVQPTDTEKILNGKRPGFLMKKRRPIEWKPQFEKAEEAFQKNGFLLLIGNKQAENLDDVFLITNGMSVSFVKLTMLVGG